MWDVDWIGLAQDRQVADACECGNEPWGSVKCGEFLGGETGGKETTGET